MGSWIEIRSLITLAMDIAGVVLVVSGVLAIAYHYKHYFVSLGLGPDFYYVYPYTLVGLVLCILGSVMLIVGSLLFLALKNDLTVSRENLSRT